MRVDSTIRTLSLIVLAACGAAGSVQAAPTDSAGAKAAFVEGERDFQLGKFEAAIDAYERAFGLDPQPAFLFNIALAHRRQYEIDGKLDHLARARELYRNYLKLDPQSSRRAGVEKLIAELTVKIDEGRARSEPVVPIGSAPPASAPAEVRDEATHGTAPVPSPAVERAPPPTAASAVVVTAPDGRREPPRGSSRKWIIGGDIAAAAVVTAVAIFFVARSDTMFDGPGVNVTPGMHP